MDEIQEPQNKAFARKACLALAVVLLLAVGGYAGYLRYQHGPTAKVSDKIAVLEERLQNQENATLVHEKRIAALEEALQKQGSIKAPVASEPSTPSASDQHIAALEKEVASIKATGQLEDKDQIFAAIRLLSSYHRLSDKVLSGKPFASELSAFDDLAGDNAEFKKPLAELAPYADNGIPTYAQLLSTYDDAVDELDAAEASPPPGYTAWQRFIYIFKHLVTIHKVDAAQSGNSVDAILARASDHLEREEIEAASAELKSLPDAARNHFTDWLEDAQINGAAPGIIDELEEKVMQNAFRIKAPQGMDSPQQGQP